MIVFPFNAVLITTMRGSIRLSEDKKIIAGYRTDKASVSRAGIVIKMLAEAALMGILNCLRKTTEMHEIMHTRKSWLDTIKAKTETLYGKNRRCCSMFL